LKYEIFDEGEDLRLKLGFRYDVNIPKDVEIATTIQIICMLVETVTGVPVMQIIEDVVKEQQKNG
jgi:hypothetical protein